MRLLKLLAALVLPSLVNSCDDGWTPFEKHCYKTFSEPTIQNANANDFCKKHGATLTSVLSENERQFLVDFTNTGECIYDHEQPLIGAYRDSVHHPWKWHDGSPFTQMNYFNYPGEPSNKPGDLYMALMGNKYSTSKPFGYFIDVPIGPAKFFICKKKDVGNNPVACGERWTSFGSNCYRRFSKSTKTECGDLNAFCRSNFDATLSSITSDEERLFFIEYTRTGRPKWNQFQPIVGGYKTSLDGPWLWYDGTPFTQHNMWLPKRPYRENGLFCIRIKSDEPAWDASDTGPYGYFFNYHGNEFAANSFVCKKKGVISCDSLSMTEKDGKCVCKPDFIDIMDSDFPEAKNYSRGQKCVKKGKCDSVKETTSILFIIDSSESITANHWPKMVNFVKQGARELPKSFRVGFIKFSDKVSDKKWLEPFWSPDDYRNAVPSKYEKGQTNTPLALQEARNMFKNDNNKNRIAVLITDGMPVAAEYETQEDALNATTKAARALLKDGVRLTVMGVGPELHQEISHVRSWVRNPRKDYFSFSDTVDCLKEGDMDKLLQIVCDSS